MSAQTDKKGFTIIEVVLVLAIAALIFLMIFVALPALQRGQANTARKSDLSTISAAVNTYRTNSNGSIPADYADLANYIDKLSQLELPASGAIPNATAGASMTADSTTLDTAVMYQKARCDGDAVAVGSSRQASVLTVVETSAGKYSVVCQDA